jgi:hypothetical protein
MARQTIIRASSEHRRIQSSASRGHQSRQITFVGVVTQNPSEDAAPDVSVGRNHPHDVLEESVIVDGTLSLCEGHNSTPWWAPHHCAMSLLQTASIRFINDHAGTSSN